ncbi:MAG: protein kinase, partial [Myxococcota bacterium]|nr:protein kinase [Myxococcota bacterium]
MNKPKSIGRYRLVERVGSGGMGVVYDARDTRTNQRVALKVLLPHAAEANQGLLRFKREFRALARLRHKNIVRVFDAGLEDNVAFIAMEFIQGTNIRAHLEQFAKGKPRFEEIVRCTKAILQALSHIHARRIVHRDLKPENIMVNQNGDVKLMDFGVARVRHNSHEESGLIGTFAYMAPEVVTTSDIDGRSDLYALGVILFELLTDKFPFPVEPPAAALHHHVNTPPQLVRHLEPKAPAELAGLAHALLEKDPIERPRTATDALAWLTDTRSRPTSLPDQSVEMPGLLFVPRFVGRENVLDELQGVASDASAGRGRLIVLEGSNGMGKTRLLTEMRLRIRRRTHVLVGTAHDKAQAYDAIEPILDGIATIASQTQPDVAAKILGPDVGVVRSISPRLASLGSKQDVSHLEGRQRKIRLHKTIIGIIGRLALTRSVVLVVEDIHNVDSLSLELIWDTARTLLTDRPGGVSGETVCPFSIILTYEKSEKTKNAVGVLLRRLKRKKLMERIKLNPLAPDDVSEIISTMTGVKEPSNLLVQQVLQETSGVPGLVQETIHDYVRSQTLVRTRGKWSFNGEPIDAKETDSSVKSFFSNDTTESSVKRVRADLAQFDLTEEAISLLKTIALLGFMVPGSYVTALSETRGDAFFDWMDELVRHGVLVEELDEHSLRYTFSSRTLHSSVLRRLGAAEKTKKHGEIALALESYFWSDRITIA